MTAKRLSALAEALSGFTEACLEDTVRHLRGSTDAGDYDHYDCYRRLEEAE